MQKRLCTLAINKGLEYIAAEQATDGSFVGYLSPDPHSFSGDCEKVWTTFTPSLILGALASINTPKNRDIREKIATFLLSQRSEQWAFNYWSKKEMKKHSFQYPDDLDDTFAALIGLYLHDPTIISPKVLVYMTKLLIATESQVGGPYKTWLVPKTSTKEWLDVDIVVNSNIAYFLSLVSEVPPNLKHMLIEAVLRNNLHSPYYPSKYQVIYFISRTLLPQDINLALIEQLRNLSNTRPADDIEHALAASTLLRLGGTKSEIEPHIQHLLNHQASNGSWQPGTVFVNHHTKEQTFYVGSSSTTTAFALEAIALYGDFIQRTQEKTTKTTEDSKKQTVPAALHSDIKQYCNSLDPPLKNILETAVLKLLNSNNGMEVTTLGSQFSKSISIPIQNSSPTFLKRLSAANTYGWIAYTIYDDFIDDAGEPLLLPAANVAMRLSYDLYRNAVPDKQDFRQYVQQTFNTIDAANAWELTHCRFSVYKGKTICIETLPDYKDLAQLANRSLGHTLSPLAVLARNNEMADAFQNISTALKHYIIAKQLNDDAHDWRQDIMHGHITYVVATILKELAIAPGTYALHELLPIMQKRFWHYTLTSICSDMEYQLHLSRQALESTPLLNKNNVIATLLDSIESSVKDTLTKQAQTKEFLQYF